MGERKFAFFCTARNIQQNEEPNRQISSSVLEEGSQVVPS